MKPKLPSGLIALARERFHQKLLQGPLVASAGVPSVALRSASWEIRAGPLTLAKSPPENGQVAGVALARGWAVRWKIA